MKDIAYHMGQSVMITACATDHPAKVRAITFGRDGVQIMISYWKDLFRYEVWVYPDEIKSIAPVQSPIVKSN